MELTKSYQRITNITTTYGAIRTYAKYDSQSSTDNTTTYKLQQRYYVNSSYTSVSFDSATGTVDGTSKKYTSRTTMQQGETVIQTITRTIVHNADGSSPTKSVSSSWTASFGGGGSGTASITFPDIIRMSVPTLNQPGTNIPLFEIGDTITLYTNRPLPTYTHTLYMNIGGTPTLIGSDIGESVQIDTSLLANTLYQSSPSNARITGTFTLYTYDGETLVGSANCDYLTYIRNAEPTFDVAYKDTKAATTTITGNNQQIIQNNSTLQFNITNAGIQKYASGLSSVSITINGTTITDTISGTSGVSKDITWGTINLSQNTTASITITDSRGLSTTKTLTLTILEWQTPTADITIQRQQNFYTATDLTVDANYSSLDSKNTITIKYRTKQDGGSWGAYTTIPDNTLTTFNADNTYAWDVEIVVQDSLGSSTYTRQLGIGVPIMFIDRNNRSTGFNCFPSGNNDVFINNAPIVESGSNATGDWIRFYDGTMITTHIVSGTTNISTAWGNGYTSSTTNTISLGDYPQEFYATPVVMVTPQRSSLNYWIGACGGASTTSAGTTNLNRLTTGSNVSYSLRVVAIGRWKA